MGFDIMTTNTRMIFIEIPEGKAQNARKQIAKASHKRSVLNMKKPVYFSDQDASIAFTDVNEAQIYAIKKRLLPRFVTAGK